MRGATVQRFLIGAAIACALLSTMSFLNVFDGQGGDPRKGLADAVYASLQLFTLSMDRPPTNTSLPVVLQVTRFAAPLVTAGAVWAVVTVLARSWIGRRRARRWSGHHVVCGDSDSARAIASALSTLRADTAGVRLSRAKHHVLYMSEAIPEAVEIALRAQRILTVQTAPDSSVFADSVRNARSVTVACDGDSDTVRWSLAADRVLNLHNSTDSVAVKAVMNTAALRQISGSRVQFINFADRVSHGVIAAEPFRPTANGKGVAVIVGDGPEAVALARQVGVTATGELPQPVVLIGPSAQLAGVPQHARVHDLPLGAQLTDVAAAVNQLPEIGQPIYLWSGDSSRDMLLGLHLGGTRPGHRIVVISPQRIMGQQHDSPDSCLRVVDTQEALGRGHLLVTDFRQMLANGLDFERARHGDGRFDECEGVNAVDLAYRAGVDSEHLAGAVLDCLVDLDFELTHDELPLLQLTPTEISAIARAMVAAAGEQEDNQRVFSAFAALAGRIPRLAQYASLSLRPTGTAEARPRITSAIAASMAHEIARRYRLRTGAPPQLSAEEASDADIEQALGFSVKIAIAGLALTTNSDDECASIPEGDVELLAEFEHQRWCRNRRERGWRYGTERDNDQLLHPDMVPWSELSERSKDLDRGPVRDIPDVLAQQGFALTWGDDQRSTS